MFEQQDSILDNLKSGLDKNQGTVETVSVDEFLTGFGQLGWACAQCGIKLEDELGEVRIFESLVSRLKMHGILVLTLVFPDGDKYETVTRYNEAQQKVYTFAYKL